LLSKTIVTKLPKLWVGNPGFKIQTPENPFPDLESSGQKAPDPQHWFRGIINSSNQDQGRTSKKNFQPHTYSQQLDSHLCFFFQADNGEFILGLSAGLGDSAESLERGVTPVAKGPRRAVKRRHDTWITLADVKKVREGEKEEVEGVGVRIKEEITETPAEDFVIVPQVKWSRNNLERK
jgi:hypothetical protein